MRRNIWRTSYHPAVDRYPAGRRPWLHGGTLCYTRAFWQRNPFPELDSGEDARFLWRNQSTRMLSLTDGSFYVALVHPGNTSPKRTSDAWWHPYPTDRIRTLLGEDNAFYDAFLDAQRAREYDLSAQR